MPRDDDDAAMRAELARMELEDTEVDEAGKVVDRPYEAHRLRMTGMTWRAIAKRLDFSSEQHAQHAVKVYLQQAAVLRSNEQKEEALHTSIVRTETLMHQHWNAAMLGDIQSANVVLKCLSELNKVQGLYEVKENNVTERFVVIAQNRGDMTYAEQLRQIAIRSNDPKELESLEPSTDGFEIQGVQNTNED